MYVMYVCYVCMLCMLCMYDMYVMYVCYVCMLYTKPTEDVVRGLVSTLMISWISTFERPYGPSSQVDIQLIMSVDTSRVRHPRLVVYLLYLQAFKSIYLL